MSPNSSKDEIVVRKEKQKLTKNRPRNSYFRWAGNKFLYTEKY